ncbi:acyl-CoA dehydrogenase domain protein [Burkholderia pseudomallei]|nr:acyl-CoA dehydrogenase domain protein [Burkholderia pseudomallei]
MTDAGRPPLAAVQHDFVAFELGRRAHVRRVRRSDLRLRHAERRTDLAREQRLEPAAALLGRAVAREHLHVAGVGRVAVERLRRDERMPHQLGERGVLGVRQPRAAVLGLGQEQVPEAGRARLRLQRFHHVGLPPAPPVGVARQLLGVARLDGRDLVAHEGRDALAQFAAAGRGGEIHGVSDSRFECKRAYAILDNR